MRHTVLVVDGDPNTRDRLRASLPPRTFAVVEAPDPVSALTMLLWTPVALAVVNPRVRSGGAATPSAFDLLQCIRTEPAFAKVPVLMLADSTLSTEEERKLQSTRCELFYKLEGLTRLSARIQDLFADRTSTTPDEHLTTEFLFGEFFAGRT
jgi:DNA-binding response OmpR family regulator